MKELEWMREALELAERGTGFVSPNPMVGAVIVKEGVIIGRGYHKAYGSLHAERDALQNCEQDPKGATMFVTLEPCCHYGKQPPCTEAIAEAGIARVVVGSHDPNPNVAGKGIEYLWEKGIRVDTGLLEAECDALNEVFLHFVQNETPYVVLKYAMTMDGKIATAMGESKWITGEAARVRAHEDRHRYSAIMAGVGTVLADDPLLTCRVAGGKNPVRILCDTSLRTPLTSQIVQTAREVPTIFAIHEASDEKIKAFTDAGCEIIRLPLKGQSIDLPALMRELGARKIDSVLVEGGATLNGSVLSAGIVNKVQTYLAPKLFGGERAKTPIGGAGIPRIADAVLLTKPKITFYGDDILIESEVK